MVFIFKKAMRSDILVLAAGSIFSIQPFFEMYLALRFLKLLRGKNLRIIAVGVSIGPFQNIRDQKWCLRALSLMDSVLIRDYQSKLLIDSSTEKINAQLSFDLALSWHISHLEIKAEQKPALIGLSTTESAFGKCKTGHTDNCNTLVKAFEQILKNSNEVKIRILCVCSDKRGGDNSISNHIFEMLKTNWGARIEIVIYQEEKIAELLFSISECSLMIAARMHAGIMGMLTALPVYQISYAEKIRNFFTHTGLSTEYLYDHDKITQQSMYEFMVGALNGELGEFTEMQKKILLEKGERVSCDLDSLARQISL